MRSVSWWYVLGAVTSVMLLAGNVFAAYQPNEVLVIPWDDGEGQPMIMGNVLDETALPDSIFLTYSSGPEVGLVDRYDNVYLMSGSLNYLKGFHKDGGLFVSLISTSNDYDYHEYDEADSLPIEPPPSVFDKLTAEGKFPLESFSSFYVDTLYNIYVRELTALEGLPVVDTLGKLVRLLNPAGEYEMYTGSDVRWHSGDVITVYDEYSATYFTYRDGEFYEGGEAYGWLANDRWYYDVQLYTSGDSALIFNRYPDPTKLSYGEFEYSEGDTIETYFGSAPGDWGIVTMLGVDDRMRVFISLRPYDLDELYQIIRVYDNRFNLLEEFRIPDPAGNKYGWSLYNNYFRPSDGGIFEFRCQDDGLHVVKWSEGK